jgi:uncharacterized membrane protein
MNQRDLNKFIGYGIMVIFGYYIISSLIDYLIFGVFVMIMFRVYESYQRHK